MSFFTFQLLLKFTEGYILRFYLGKIVKPEIIQLFKIST